MASDKVRIRFRKAGDLRLVSHHDLMRCFERMLRRAAIPFHSTRGFNPKPRLIFALSLGLGIVGCQEVVELELDEPVAVDQLAEQLRQQAPHGLTILDIRRIDPKITAHVRRATYRIPLPPAQPTASATTGNSPPEGEVPPEPESPGTVAGLCEAGLGRRPRLQEAPGTLPLAERAAELLSRSEVWVDRDRPQRRRVNIRPYLDSFRVAVDSLEMDLWVTPNGTARPDELLALLGLGELLSDGAVLERAMIEIEDEVGPEAPAVPVPQVAATPEPHEIEPQLAGNSGRKSAASDQGPHPLIPGPLDY